MFDFREHHRIKRILKKINHLAPVMRKMSDRELQSQTDILRKQIKNGKTLEQVLPL
ncbi:MAG: hypothetical protein ACI4TY_05930, partial [Candidatus Limosilactobacillus intestinavium]